MEILCLFFVSQKWILHPCVTSLFLFHLSPIKLWQAKFVFELKLFFFSHLHLTCLEIYRMEFMVQYINSPRNPFGNAANFYEKKRKNISVDTIFLRINLLQTKSMLSYTRHSKPREKPRSKVKTKSHILLSTGIIHHWCPPLFSYMCITFPNIVCTAAIWCNIYIHLPLLLQDLDYRGAVCTNIPWHLLKQTAPPVLEGGPMAAERQSSVTEPW